MTHKFDIDHTIRQENAILSQVHTAPKDWCLMQLIEMRYPDTAYKLIDPEIYQPIKTTDEVEAAIFALAWGDDPGPLFCKFKQDGLVSLFERFGPFFPKDDRTITASPIVVYRGTYESKSTDINSKMSWSFSKDWASTFANKNHQKPVVFERHVHPNQILMALPNDGEEEVVVLPGPVFDIEKC